MSEERIRRLRYRLGRIGLLEVELWLLPLLAAVETDRAELLDVCEQLLVEEGETLLAMQRGEIDLPSLLQPYLAAIQ